nr:MAG TPA: Photosynthetic reaction centre, H-chain N-terminal region [Caudoviricetes sp.]
MKSVTHLIRVCNYFSDLAEKSGSRSTGGGGARPGRRAATLSPYIFFILFFCFLLQLSKNDMRIGMQEKRGEINLSRAAF